MLILATITPDSPLPATACIVQENIGALNAAAFDLASACSGFLYAMNIAKRFVESGAYKNVLIIGAETLSSVINYDDRSTAVLFGDGAGAAVISAVENGGILSITNGADGSGKDYLKIPAGGSLFGDGAGAAVISAVEEGGILSITNGADGSGKDYLKIPAGGSRIKAGEESIRNKLHTVQMAGNDVFKFAVRKMADESVKAVEAANLTLEDIDFLIPHQANIRIIDSSAKRLKLEKDKVYVNLTRYGNMSSASVPVAILTRYGNMSSASVPVAIDEAFREGKLKKGDKVVLVGFGGGLTWGASVVEWSI